MKRLLALGTILLTLTGCLSMIETDTDRARFTPSPSQLCVNMLDADSKAYGGASVVVGNTVRYTNGITITYRFLTSGTQYCMRSFQ